MTSESNRCCKRKKDVNQITLITLINQITFKADSLRPSLEFCSIESGNFSVRGYLPLIRKDSATHMLGLVVYVKKGLHFAPDLSLENSADSYVFD